MTAAQATGDGIHASEDERKTLCGRQVVALLPDASAQSVNCPTCLHVLDRMD